MRSIPAAMTWEFFARGRWALPAAALGAFLFPAIVFTAMEHDGSLNPHDPSMLVMCMVMLQLNMLAFVAALMSAQRPMSRLYALPASTATLVAWRLLPAMAAIAVESVAWTAAVNAMFQLNWPLWGPAMFAAAGLAAVEAAMWLTEKSGWIIFALTVVGIVLGVWFKSRHGMVSELPTHLWSAVTPAEVFTMLATTALSYWVAVKAVARNRRGEPPFSLGIMDWLIRLFDVAPAVGAPFRGPAHAQFWVEWRRKGEVMPAIVVVCLVAWLVIWFFASRDAEDLVNGFLAGGGLLSAVGLACGLVHGNVGTNDSEFAIGHFMATRPITNADLTRTILRAAAQSVLLAWAIWATAFLFAFLMLMLFDAVPMVELPEGLGWWYFPATFAGLWTTVGCMTSIGLAGRAKLSLQLVCGLIAAFIGLTLFSKFGLSSQAQWQFERAEVVVIGGALVMGTAWMLLAARRRLLIQWPTVWGAAGAWAVALALALFQLPAVDKADMPSILLVAGLLALAVAPLAAAPLALTWNRHR